MIYHHRKEYEVKAMCEFFGISQAPTTSGSNVFDQQGVHPMLTKYMKLHNETWQGVEENHFTKA
jgi:hypothetical protein